MSDPRRPSHRRTPNQWLELARSGAEQFTTPLSMDDYTRLANPLWTARELRGRIVRVDRVAGTEAAHLVIARGWGLPRHWDVGQYIGLGVRVEGRWLWRSYSLTEPPHRSRGRYAITVQAHQHGQLSRHLVELARPGTVVRLAAPEGDFVLPSPPPRRALFLTAGSGITPVVGMLRALDSGRLGGEFGDVVHVHSVRHRGDHLFDTELTALAARRPGYRRIVRETALEGRLQPGDLDAVVPDWRTRETWACGSAAMVGALERHHREQGVADLLHTERFAVARAAPTAGGSVTFAPADAEATTVDVDGATSLLEAGEAAGVPMPSGCRMGICQTCVWRVDEGHARSLLDGSDAEPGETIRTCVSVAAGGLRVSR